jgi:hypothetical protein
MKNAQSYAICDTDSAEANDIHPWLGYEELDQ